MSPLCSFCHDYFPPDFVDKDPDTKQYKCHFCLNEKTVLFGTNNVRYERNAVINDYKALVKNLAENENIRREMTNNMVKDAIAGMK